MSLKRTTWRILDHTLKLDASILMMPCKVQRSVCLTLMHTCRVGLDDHLKKARSLIDELERLFNDVNIALETENPPCTSTVSDEDLELNEEEATVPNKKPDASEYALLMGIIKVMVKKDHRMQEKIVSGLGLKSSSGELETYCLMWSLRPYIDDEIMHQAWKLI